MVTKDKDKKPSGKKPGGQEGHTGTTLMPVAHPDVIVDIAVDQTDLPVGQYTPIGYKSAQVVDIKFTKFVTEYRAEIIKSEDGVKITAPFPIGVTRSIQYGASIKEHAVYLATAQFLPYERLKNQFLDQYKIALSCGSIFNFIKEAAERLEPFQICAKNHLSQSIFMHADETGMQIKNKLHWLHSASNDVFTFLEPHAKRGRVAFDEINIIPHFQGILIHDHWAPYMSYNCEHAFCNAHHLRELTWSYEEEKQNWALEMRVLLEAMNVAVHEAGGVLTAEVAKPWVNRYTEIINKGEIECPHRVAEEPSLDSVKKRGKVAQTKSRNLLKRLKDYQTETLRFLTNPLIPFTNNPAEQSLRMEKVKQKISGCYRSMESAKDFALLRSYLLSCAKNDVSASEALRLLFQGKWPAFVDKALLAGKGS